MDPTIQNRSTEVDLLEAAKYYFTIKDLDKSIFYYQQASVLNKSNSFTHSNLAICYFRQGKYENSVQECDLAIEISPGNLKALIVGAKSLYNLCIISQSLRSIDKADRMISQVKEFSKIENKLEFYEAALEVAKKVVMMRRILKENHASEVIVKLRRYYGSVPDSNIQTLLHKYLKTSTQEIPDSLLCPITLDLFINPCCTSIGHTYETQYLGEYFRIKGYKDPKTNESICYTLLPNKNVKAAVEDYKDMHPWLDEERKKSISTYFT